MHGRRDALLRRNLNLSGQLSQHLLQAGRVKIKVRVKPGAKKTAVEKQTDGTWVVKVKEPAKEGRANEAVIETLAEYLNIPKQSVQIVRGRTSRNKRIEIKDAGQKP